MVMTALVVVKEATAEDTAVITVVVEISTSLALAKTS